MRRLLGGRRARPGRRLLVASLVALAAVAVAEPAAASVGSERAETSAAATSSQCGPCPSVVFGKGSGGATIDVVTVDSSGTPMSTENCSFQPRGQCTFYLEEGFVSDKSFVSVTPAAGSTFWGWEECTEVRPSDRACVVDAGTPVVLCAVVGPGPNPPPESDCPPPSVQLYKKGTGTGSVNLSQPPRNYTCAVSAPSCVWTDVIPSQTVTLTASPSPGTTFVRWDGCPSVQGTTCSFLLTRGAQICSVFMKAGETAPTDTRCPYVTPPGTGGGGGGGGGGGAVKPKPPRLGSRCTIPGSRFGDTIRGPRTSDVICARAGADRIFGGRGHDLLLGGNGNDRLYGQAGYDRLRGEAGNDILTGGSNEDILEGGSGRDTIYARDGAADTVRCGRGRDVAYVDRRDRVSRDCEVRRRR